MIQASELSIAEWTRSTGDVRIMYRGISMIVREMGGPCRFFGYFDRGPSTVYYTSRNFFRCPAADSSNTGS
jgi:hypothetical protein